MPTHRIIPVLVLPAQKQRIDYGKYLGLLWGQRIQLAKSVGVALLIGLVYFMASGREYTSELVLLPEYQNQKQQSELFSNLILAEGIGGNKIKTYRGSSDAVRVQLYPSIATSVPMMKKVIDHSYQIAEEESPFTLTEYFQEVYSPSLLGYVYMYIAWIPELVIETIKWMVGVESSNEQPTWVSELGLGQEYVYLTKDEQKLMRAMQERVNAEISMDDYTFSVSASMPDAELAAQVAQVVVSTLTEYVNAYRTEKLALDLQFIEERMAEAEQRVNEARMALATFRDRNRNVVSEVYRTEEITLDNEYQLAYSVYSTLTQDREQKRIQLQEETPIFKVLEPANIPVQPSSPNVPMLFVVFALLGLFVGIARLILQSNSFEFYLRRNTMDASHTFDR